MQLAARALQFSAGGRSILQDVSVQARGGEFIAVIGPNGAGKSTLLRLLAGLAPPHRGEVTLDGRSLAHIPMRELARIRAYLPQQPRCDWPLPVERLVGLGLTPLLPAMGDFGAAERARIDTALAACDLTAKRHQAVSTLSGGERARAMLARALVADPAVLVVDEPLDGLDPRHAQEATTRLHALATDQGKLVIAAVHDLTLALRRASRIWALRDGRLLGDGPAHEVLTPDLLERLFDVRADIVGVGARAYVDISDAR